MAQDGASIDASTSLSNLLLTTGREQVALGPTGLSAIGLDLKADANLSELIPEPSLIPDFARWSHMSIDEAQAANQSTRQPLRTGLSAPGCHVYIERKRELSNTNEAAFRTVRRLPPPRGKQHARLGNAYEFFRCLELYTTFWDDPTKPPSLPPSPELSASHTTADATATAEHPSNSPDIGNGGEPNRCLPSPARTAAGHQMPMDYRTSLIAAFIKLVAYDFGCNVASARVEPRLQMKSPRGHAGSPRKSYCSSRCQFIFQSPRTREAARAGLAYGPVAAVSCRPTVNFATPTVEAAQSLDLAREVIAALITAQHRAREGRNEIRFGHGEWWTTRRRWGGGPGGPIGREIAKDDISGDKDASPAEPEDGQMPGPKRPRKNLAMYDNYRMVRPPASTWDRKLRYEAIGKQHEKDHDDIFVVSSLFHHVSIMRVRVPVRLLEVLDGAPEPDATQRSWGNVTAWRSPWYDLFDTSQRIAAMEAMWSVMAYQMRDDTGHGSGSPE